jgi:hypothetical protein
MPSSERIVSVPNKPHLCNYGSHLGHIINGPGLDQIHYASGRLVSGPRPHCRLALQKENGEVIQAKLIKTDWKPYLLLAEFEFPDGLKISQRSWVEGAFLHSSISFEGTPAAGCKLIADGVSWDAAKAMVSPDKTVMLDEMSPSYKPMVLELSSSVAPDRVMLSRDGKKWKESDYIWGNAAVHYRMVFDRVPKKMILSAHLGKLANQVEADEWEKSRRREADVKREWLKAYAEELPEIDCPDQRYRDMFQFCWYVHRSGILTPGGMLPYPFVLASKLGYPMWWMVDCAYMSMLDVWMKDQSIATGTLLNHTMMQSKKGCIPDAGCAYQADNGEIKWIHPEQYDDYPPPSTSVCVIGMAAWDIYTRTGNLDFVKKIYPHLVNYEAWVTKEKTSPIDPDLVAHYYWADVAWDDSKRWGKGGHCQTCDWDLPVIPIDQNVYLLLLRDILSKMSGLFGEDDLRRDYADRAARTRRAIDQRMWNENEGFYFDLLGDGKMLEVWTPAGFAPLLAGIPGADSYQRMKEHLFNPNKFWTKYPLPTLAIDDPDCSFENLWWRGGTWPVINWQVAEGVFRYDPEAGLRIVDATVNMMTHNGFPNCTEYYTPDKATGKGQIDQGWGAMPVDNILRRVFGLIQTMNGLELKPCLPADWPDASVRNVFVAGTNVEVRYTRSAAGLKAAVKNNGSKAINVTVGDSQITLEPDKEGTLAIS